jgi:hypothetical protein
MPEKPLKFFEHKREFRIGYELYESLAARKRPSFFLRFD